jgi:processive 1,2-diacylglycerol beta-glucosyltransferase
MRAAEAVEAACRTRYPRATVQHVDVLTLTPRAFRKVYADAYLDIVNRAPELVGLLYDRTNRTPRRGAGDRVRLEVEKLNTRKVAELAREFRPDVIVHTHFLPAEIVAHEKERGRITAPHVVVVTDFDVHRFWLCPGADRYFVAREDNKVHLTALGESADRVRITGIPILPVFGAAPDIPALRRKHKVDSAKPLLLVLCGGFGVGPIEGLVKQLWASVRGGAQIAVVAGRNEELRATLETAAAKAAVPTQVLGFTREMHEWMALASLVVTKPGGLTTSEALACGLPIVVANAIPGQETRNATMLFEEGVAMSGDNPYTIGPRVARLLASPARLAAMARAARRLGRPRAALDVADELAVVTAG